MITGAGVVGGGGRVTMQVRTHVHANAIAHVHTRVHTHAHTCSHTRVHAEVATRSTVPDRAAVHFRAVTLCDGYAWHRWGGRVKGAWVPCAPSASSRPSLIIDEKGRNGRAAGRTPPAQGAAASWARARRSGCGGRGSSRRPAGPGRTQAASQNTRPLRVRPAPTPSPRRRWSGATCSGEGQATSSLRPGRIDELLDGEL